MKKKTETKEEPEIKKETVRKPFPKVKTNFEYLPNKPLIQFVRKVTDSMEGNHYFAGMEHEMRHLRLALNRFENACSYQEYRNYKTYEKLIKSYRNNLLCQLYAVCICVKLKAAMHHNCEAILKSAGFVVKNERDS